MRKIPEKIIILFRDVKSLIARLRLELLRLLDKSYWLLHALLAIILLPKSQNLWLHIGAPRTASTTLQQDIFSLHSQLSFVWLSWFYTLDLPALFRIPLAVILSKGGGKIRTHLASSEILSSKIYIRLISAKRLPRIIINTNILYVTRHEVDHLHSLWLNYTVMRLIKDTPSQLQREFTADEFFSLAGPNSPLWPTRASYSDVLSPALLLKTLEEYGCRNMQILTYETFVDKPREYLDRLSQILGVSAGITWRLYENALRRSGRKVSGSKWGMPEYPGMRNAAMSERGLKFCRVFRTIRLDCRGDFEPFLKGARNYMEENLPPTVKNCFLRRLAEIKDKWNGDSSKATATLLRDEIFLQWVAKGERVKPQFSAKTLAELRRIRAPQNRWMAKKFNLDLAKYGYAM